MRKELQVIVPGTVDLSVLIGIGAENLGQVVQKDTYLAAEDGTTWRVREQNGEYILAQKGHDLGDRARVKDVDEKLISKKEADRLVREMGVRTVVCKSRTLFRLDSSVIAIDEVEHLGEFVEIRSTTEENLFRTLQALGLSEEEASRESYLDMMLAQNLPGWLSRLIRFHDRVGELIFGIASGILTTVGMLVGMNAATDSRLAVVAGILVIAMADSLSDSFGMYLSKLGERGSSPAAAIRYAAGTFLGKFACPLTFVIPLLLPLVSLKAAVSIDLVWAAIVLALLSLEQAVVAQSSVFRVLARNLGLATVIVVLSTVIGSVVSRLIA